MPIYEVPKSQISELCLKYARFGGLYDSRSPTTSRTSCMPIIQVRVNDTETVFALLDTASTSTFCTESLVDKLGIQGRSQNLILNTLSDSVHTSSKFVELTVSSMDTCSKLDMNGVYVTKHIPVKSANVDVLIYEHLAGIDFAASCDITQVDLLIGQDHSSALMPLDVRRGRLNEPFAIRSLLGWCINGNIPTCAANQSVISHFVQAEKPNLDSIERNVNRLWEIDNDAFDKDGPSLEDREVLKFWDNNCKKVDGHYEIPIPWKAPEEPLPNNINVAKSRLFSLAKKLKRDGLTERYQAEIDLSLDKGYIEIVPESDMESNPGRTWYLPHRHVINEKKPGKLRVVYDCSSSYGGKSLNDRIFQGPDNINKIRSVTLRFRQHAFAFQADIEAMYNQVSLPVYDRDALIFLWLYEGKLVCYRHRSCLFGGIWCSSVSTYALRRTVQDQSEVPASVSSTINNDFYVDDVLKSIAAKGDVMSIIDGTSSVLQEGGFNLTKFVINDAGLLSNIDESKRAKEVKNIAPEMLGKALGIKWDIGSDAFYFEMQKLEDCTLTRRVILSIVSSLYDPLGFVGPLMVQGKLIFQDLTRLKLGWDDTVPDSVSVKWFKWLECLDTLNALKIPRCVKPCEFDDAVIELHNFSDASLEAYGACSYIRCINRFGMVHTQLLVSKNKVAPVKQCTIPRLELQAALMAANLDHTIRHELELQITGSYFWTDSQVVLAYIRNESARFHIFVSNRVSKIRQLTNPEMWRYVRTDQNPADLLTRSKYLTESQLRDTIWFQGPSWLSDYKSQWSSEINIPVISPADPEVKLSTAHACAVYDPTVDLLYRVCVHYSSWIQMQRAVAWLMRFIEFKTKALLPNQTEMSLNEINRAKVSLLKQAQKQHFASEFRCLVSNGVVNKSSSISSLSPYIDEDGLIRVGGRTGEHPIIVPTTHPVSQVLVLHYHGISHSGLEWTLSLIRQEYWIPRARPLVRKVINQCVVCRRLYAKPNTQIMANLPLERLQSDIPVFTNSGVDVFGPILIRNYRSDIKRYGLLFTCMSVRAIHIEKLNSLDTDSFINAFRRFIARRGTCRKVFSDNGTNFVSAEKTLRLAMKEVDMKRVQAYAAMQSVEWEFIPPSAPHMGGAWERMIGTVKRVMKAVLFTESRLNDEILETIFCEIEMIVNNRPLSKFSDHHSDLSPLTPNHLMLLKGGPNYPIGKFDKDDVYRRRWRHVQHVADRFWSRWRKLYLPELQKRVKWTDVSRNLSVGDLVLIADENTPRNVWPLALVSDVTKGRDGMVRSVKVKTRTSVLVRPITKIILLEGVEI